MKFNNPEYEMKGGELWEACGSSLVLRLEPY